MKIFNFKNSKNIFSFGRRHNGFALLFTVLIISVIATVTFGLASIVYKQKLLTSISVDSGRAFYMADSGMECTLYALSEVSTQSTPVLCLDPTSTTTTSVLSLTQNNGPAVPNNQYVDSSRIGNNNACFTIEPIFDSNSAFISAKVRGYSTCNTSSPRHLERTLQVFFQ
ncbi:MAG: hypothetical protein ACR2IQ_01395 [Minisyncoccia bacterium]